MPSTTEPSSADRPPFRALPLIVAVLCILLGITLANQWYAENIAMPRFCDEPAEATLQRIKQLLNEQKPTDDDFESRRPYIVAAKLLFLLPRNDGESEEAYLGRIARHLQRECG